MIADVLERLDKAKVSAVGLDIVLDRPTEPELDARLAAVMRSVDVPVVIVEDLSDAESEAVCAGRAVQRQSNPQILPVFSAVTGQAHGLICSDTLGNIVRFAPRAAGVESFAEALHRANGGNVAAQPYMASLPYKPAVETAWPFPTYSAAHIDVIPDEWLTGKTVLIGKITPYSGDFFSTPLRFNSALPPTEPKELMPKGVLPGVIVHRIFLVGFAKRHVWHHAQLGKSDPLRLFRCARWGFSRSATLEVVAHLRCDLCSTRSLLVAPICWLQLVAGHVAASLLRIGARTYSLERIGVCASGA